MPTAADAGQALSRSGCPAAGIFSEPICAYFRSIFKFLCACVPADFTAVVASEDPAAAVICAPTKAQSLIEILSLRSSFRFLPEKTTVCWSGSSSSGSTLPGRWLVIAPSAQLLPYTLISQLPIRDFFCTFGVCWPIDVDGRSRL